MSRRPDKQPRDPDEPEPTLWGFDALARHARHEDPEVRAWAVGRLMHHYPERCADVISSSLLDAASDIGDKVAEHLARHGSERHFAILERAFRHGRDRVPGAALEALARLGYPSPEELAASAVSRAELSEEAVAGILVALSRYGEPAPAREVALAHLRARPAVLVEPAATRAVFGYLDPSEFPLLIETLLSSLAWRGADRAAPAFQAIIDALEGEDAGWLLHTNTKDRIDIERTMKGYDATFDAETRRSVGDAWMGRFRTAFQDGSLPIVAATLREFCAERATVLAAAGDPVPRRIQAFVASLTTPETLQAVERLGPAAASPVIITLLSCALKLAAFRSLRRELDAAKADLDRLLSLMEVESAALLDRLPEAVEGAVRDGATREQAVRFAVEMLGRRGPWYGRLLALDILGRLRAVEAAHEVIGCLHDESDHVLEAAGHALEKMGPEVVAPVRAVFEEGHVDPDGMEWMVAAVCQAGTAESVAFILEHFDELVHELDAGFVCDWAGVLGAEELIPRLRHHLEQDVAAVGRALVLVSGIHNRHVPEQERIFEALDREADREDPGSDEGHGGEGGPYVM